MGDKLCIKGKCQSVAIQSAKEKKAAQEGSAKDWFRAYADISIVSNIYTWGLLTSHGQYYQLDPDITDTASFRGFFAPGLRIAGYSVSFDHIHFGGYFKFTVGRGVFDPEMPENRTWIPHQNRSSFTTIGLGLSAKFGGQPTEKMFVGLDVDMGLQFFRVMSWEGENDFNNITSRGFELRPCLVFDFMVVDKEKVKIAVPVRIGVEILPASGYDPYDHTTLQPLEMEIEYEGSTDYYNLETLDFVLRYVSLFASIGLSFGK